MALRISVHEAGGWGACGWLVGWLVGWLGSIDQLMMRSGAIRGQGTHRPTSAADRRSSVRDSQDVSDTVLHES